MAAAFSVWGLVLGGALGGRAPLGSSFVLVRQACLLGLSSLFLYRSMSVSLPSGLRQAFCLIAARAVVAVAVCHHSGPGGAGDVGDGSSVDDLRGCQSSRPGSIVCCILPCVLCRVFGSIAARAVGWECCFFFRLHVLLQLFAGTLVLARSMVVIFI